MSNESAERAAKCHTDLNVFASLVSILEGGCVYTESGQHMAQRIIKLCKEESSRQLREYDKAIAAIGELR